MSQQNPRSHETAPPEPPSARPARNPPPGTPRPEPATRHTPSGTTTRHTPSGATTRHRLMVPPTRAPGSPDRSGRPVQPRAGRFTWNGHHSHTAPLRPPRAARRHSELTSTVPGSTHVRGPCILACAPPVHNLVLSTVSPDQWTGDARSATAYPARPTCRAAHRVSVFRASTELPRHDPRARRRARLLSRGSS